MEIEGREAEDPTGHTARPFQEPRTPAAKERREHELTHLPYRPWCWFCRGARGYALNHPHSDELCEVPIVSADYFFMGESEEPGCIASLAIKDCRSKSLISFAVPRKGKDVYAVQRVLQALAFFGHRRAIHYRID